MLWQPFDAIEVKRVVLPSGNMWLVGQQIWLGPAVAGIDVDRTVNAAGLVSLSGRYYNVGFHLAGQRVTLRLHGEVMAVLAGHKLMRSLACPISLADRGGLRGARPSPCRAPGGHRRHPRRAQSLDPRLDPRRQPEDPDRQSPRRQKRDRD
jgi:hypothetical protein